MSESSSETLSPPSQETLNGIWSRVTDLTKDGYQPKSSNWRAKTKEQPDGHMVHLTAINEIGERLDPNQALATIIITNPRNKQEELAYSLYKNSSGEKRIEKNKPRPKRDLLTVEGSIEEVVAKARRLKEEALGEMEDKTIRRFRGLPAIAEPEAKALLDRLTNLK